MAAILFSIFHSLAMPVYLKSAAFDHLSLYGAYTGENMWTLDTIKSSLFKRNVDKWKCYSSHFNWNWTNQMLAWWTSTDILLNNLFTAVIAKDHKNKTEWWLFWASSSIGKQICPKFESLCQRRARSVWKFRLPIGRTH